MTCLKSKCALIFQTNVKLDPFQALVLNKNCSLRPQKLYLEYLETDNWRNKPPYKTTYLKYLEADKKRQSWGIWIDALSSVYIMWGES